MEHFSIKPAIRSLGDSHGHLKLFNGVNTDSLDSKKENQSVFICENLCPINLRSLLLCKIAFSVCSLKGLRRRQPMRSIGRVWRVSDGLTSRACLGHRETRHSILSEHPVDPVNPV